MSTRAFQFQDIDKIVNKADPFGYRFIKTNVENLTKKRPFS